MNKENGGETSALQQMGNILNEIRLMYPKFCKKKISLRASQWICNTALFLVFLAMF